MTKKNTRTEGAEEGFGQDLAERRLEQFLLSGDRDIPGFLAQTLRTPLEEGRRERLREGHREEGDDTREDHVHPDDPPPSDRLADETTDDGTEDGTAVRGCGEERDREATLIVVPDVGDGAAGEGEGCGGEEATEETADKECLYVRGDGARDVEDDIDDIGDDPKILSTDQLALYGGSATHES